MDAFRQILLRLDPGDDRLARLSRLYAVVVFPGLLAVLLVMGWPMTDGRHDLAGATFGHDLSQVWVAGRTALAGHAEDVYATALHHRRLIETFGPDAALFAWHYPPVFLIVAALLARLPYAAAVLVWGLASVLLIACALRTILGAWRPVVLALVLPPVFECLGYGQNGLLTATLLGLGLAWIDRRPILAGLLFGLVCYKPQLAVLTPLLMLLTGRWRVAAASLTSAAIAGAISYLMFGPAVWLAFLHGLSETDTIIFKEAWGGLALNTSAFGAIRLLGGSLRMAWAVQIGVSIVASGLAFRLWRVPCPQPFRNAVLLAAIPLVSPYMPIYDLAVLVPACAFFIMGVRTTGGLDAGERFAILALFALAFDVRDLTTVTHVPCGFLLVTAVFALFVTGASRRLAAAASLQSAPHAITLPAPVAG